MANMAALQYFSIISNPRDICSSYSIMQHINHPMGLLKFIFLCPRPLNFHNPIPLPPSLHMTSKIHTTMDISHWMGQIIYSLRNSLPECIHDDSAKRTCARKHMKIQISKVTKRKCEKSGCDLNHILYRYL